jgi:hypothetical protein
MTYQPFTPWAEACRQYGLDAVEIAGHMRDGLEWVNFPGKGVHFPTVCLTEFMADKYPKLRAVV